SGSFKPAGSLAAFNFDPSNPNDVADPNKLRSIRGNWTLEITDNASGNAGALNGWSLLATPVFTVTPNPPGTKPGLEQRTFRIGFPTQALPGTYSLVLGPNISSAFHPAGTTAGEGVDTNLNAGLSNLRGLNPNGLNQPATTTVTPNLTLPAQKTSVSSIQVT